MKRERKKTRVPVRALILAVLCPLLAFGASDLSAYTKPSELVQSDDAASRAWAAYIIESAGAKTETEKIRAICAWYAENMTYDRESFLRVRELPAGERVSALPRYDHLSVLTAVSEYATGERKDKPASLCGGFVYGAAGSLRALGIPVRVEIGKIARTVGKGESYYDASGVRRFSANGGETPHTRLNGRWVKIADLHARLRVWDAARGLWIHADPAFAAASNDPALYLDMSEETHAERWTFIYTASERTPPAWKENPSPKATPAPPPAQ
jgi:transglutaminase-like putative cysteine protease